MNKTSKLFWPLIITPKNAVIKHVQGISRSQKLMTDLGLIRPANNGTFHIMPLAQRSLDKCIALVHKQMREIDGQHITLPVLTAAKLWQKTGRLDNDIDEFYMLRDRHGKQFLLSPTHEEAITAMLATTAPISYRQLPLRLYQIGPKFRDELKARFGLMRAKEFLMKDMYTFDSTQEEARDTYEQVIGAYSALFKRLQVPFEKVEAATGMMGGKLSHEFHYISDTGEDIINRCNSCGHATNAEVENTEKTCKQCSSSDLKEMRGIEVGHAFLLGDKYSQPLGATFLPNKGKSTPLVMGCYGIGITRLVAASLEVLSTETELRWPSLLAPFDVCIISPKQGSKEQQAGEAIEAELSKSLQDICSEDVLYEDRKNMTIGKRLMDSKKMGYPLIVVIGSKSLDAQPKLEVHRGDKVMELEPNEVLNYIKDYKKEKLSI
ncbi:probable proline--tRNA ligase, mitochondrial [Teleopsis dalmanni]|uniref:probable proline--tRNA ligase, mitochondrial n=1 Tax=Teleopsis dalmanni TaxID=139649 RepID=UPI0018CD4876|nr:probable proline--tRNA ligase, mitochondrial [Teleopsis dalmanni]